MNMALASAPIGCVGLASTSAMQRASPSAAGNMHMRPCVHGARHQLAARQPQRQQLGRRDSLVARVLTAEAQSLDVTKMAPLGDRLLVQPEEESGETAGGLIMSTSGSKPIHEALIGTVMAVGEDVEISVAKGDKVLFSKQGSSDVPVPEGEVCFVQERSVMAKLS